jgi:hypothetical protein
VKQYLKLPGFLGNMAVDKVVNTFIYVIHILEDAKHEKVFLNEHKISYNF